MLTVPQHPLLWGFMDDYAFHRRRYTREDLVGKVERAGLDIVRATSFVSILLPLMLLSRLKRRRSKDDFDLVAQLSINPVLNAALEKALEVERVLIGNRLSFPFGGSLLIVAERSRQ